MKKLLKKIRDWVIRRLGGVTTEEVAEAADEWNRQMDEASDRIAWLTKEYARKTLLIWRIT